MKEEKGITLMSLIIYVISMIIVLGVMSVITTNFYKNTDTVQGNVQEIIEFSKFNNYFLKEVKTPDNKIDTIYDNYILFVSGNSFSISNNAIYYNNIKICNDVQNMKMEFVKNADGTIDNKIVKVTLDFKGFNKSINYKLENIY